jgi:NAD(P)-dependent dehydrogenase (short-subunit alcohol dehydrogenase family)
VSTLVRQGQERRPSLLYHEEATEQPFGKPQELVGALVWLASDGASFVTGITVLIDGGFSTH